MDAPLKQAKGMDPDLRASFAGLLVSATFAAAALVSMPVILALFVAFNLYTQAGHTCSSTSTEGWAVAVVRAPDGEVSVWAADPAVFRQLFDDGYVERATSLANQAPSR